MEKFIISTFFLILLLSFVSAISQEYNFNITNQNKTLFAYSCETSYPNYAPLNDKFPLCNGVFKEESFNNALDNSDDIWLETRDDGVNVWQLYYSKIDFNEVQNPISINWTWEGSIKYGSGIINLSVWNNNQSKWEYITSTSGSNDVIKELNLNNPKNYIDTLNRTFLIMYYNKTNAFLQFPRTDYVKININYIPNTTLLPITSLDGNYKNNGDNFIFKVNITNIGNYIALNCFVKLNVTTQPNGDFPIDWVVIGNYSNYSLGNIEVGQSKLLNFNITRGKTDETIESIVFCFNTIPTSSEQIPIPINLIVYIALISSIIAITLSHFIQKPNKINKRKI